MRALQLKYCLVLCCCTLLAGCESLSYYQQAITGHLSLLHRAKPIDRVLQQAPGTELARKLALVQEVRDFARSRLKLPVGRAYSNYVELSQDHVVWNVFATGELSTQPVRWCFPVAGCVAYRGYFDREAARRKADALANKGYDTHVAAVAAYSTLGWTADPVLSSFVTHSDVGLASLLFHELSHRLLYVRGDTEFNESFASAVEEFALQRWIAGRERSETGAAAPQTGDLSLQLQRLQAGRELRKEFVSMVAHARETLQRIYDSDSSDEQKRLEKQSALDKLRAAVLALTETTPYAQYYQRWTDSMNNATLVPVALYSRWLPALRWKLQQSLVDGNCSLPGTSLQQPQCQRALESFYDACRELADMDADDRRDKLDAWQREADMAAKR